MTFMSGKRYEMDASSSKEKSRNRRNAFSSRKCFPSLGAWLRDSRKTWHQWIVRTAQVMGYPQPGWILRPQKAGHAIAGGELELLQRPLNYELLMRLLFYAGQTIRICPRCLDEPDGYQRLYSRATPVLLCSRYCVWLIDSCPACHKPIPGLRPQMSTCPTCGVDYQQRILPLAPEANWLCSTHRVFLMHFGIDVTELGESLPVDEPSSMQDLPAYDYFWIVPQFLEILCAESYCKRMLPLFLRALPVENVAPPTIQCALLLLHYLLANWPVHFWIALERFQQALEEDLLWFHSSYAPTQLGGGAVWDQGATREQSMAFLHTFFDMAKDYFQPHRYPRQPDASLGKHIAPTTLPVAYQLRPPKQEELVASRPWEDLASISGRVARNMGYEHSDWVLILIDAPRRKGYSREIPLLHCLADYQVFERILGLDEAKIYHMTLHRFAPPLQSPEQEARATSSYSGIPSSRGEGRDHE